MSKSEENRSLLFSSQTGDSAMLTPSSPAPATSAPSPITHYPPPSEQPPPSYSAHPGGEGYYVDPEAAVKPVVITAEAGDPIRRGFIRKVYTILAAQIGLSVLIGAMLMFANGGSFRTWILQNVWAFYVPLAVAFVSLIVLNFIKRKTPWNFVVLSIFTVCEAFSIGTAVSLYDSRVVLQAVIITFALFVLLTIFTIQSKFDFSGLGPFLFIALFALIIAGFVQLFLPFNRVTDLVIAVIGALVFCGYTVFDTYMIVNRASPEDYIIAAVELYLDILNLFLYILKILSSLKSN
ncbi:UPF0005-domain-containing protein [Gonapodya prolifera JEL478]|uniref:UPF0005-domain-containing protein n=1 Tax=Gonapodya prolifera (strain JEL478) TaxID=1344416 RepID=A0A139AG81_GONPJ|nr:UPF0005-domain-containing protein [Gonapodya prolifera JEL478]|eukprot:KXS15770.1 UPF0005-domain-containing protein [Gonapodya prolifera JEL478]